MRKILFFALTLLSHFVSSQILKKYEKEHQKLSEIITSDTIKAKIILSKIESSKDYNNDTLKTYNYWFFGNLYNKKNNAKSLNYYRKCIDLGIKTKVFDKVASCFHNQAEIFSIKNKIDTAISLDKKAIQYARMSKNLKEENIAHISIARKLRFKGDFEQSNKILFNRIKFLKESESETKGVAFATIAANYDQLAIPKLSEQYYKKANHYLKKSNDKRLASNNMANLVDFYNTNEEYNKALKYADSIIYYSDSDNSKVFFNLHKAKAYKGLKNWSLALKYINNALDLDKKLNDSYAYAVDLIMKGQIYLDKGDYSNAYSTLKDSKNIFEKEKIEDMVMEKQLYRDYVLSYLKINNSDLADDYENFLNVNDTLTFQSSDKNIIDLEKKYNSSEKEKKIFQQNLLIEKEKTNRNIAISGIGFLLLLSGGGFWFFKNRQKQKDLQNQNTLLGLQQNLNAMELQSLNKQLDPHEIKNLLASISPEIQEKAPESYRKMLKLFNITKASLNSHSLTESIENQIQQTEDFLSLEKSMLPEPLEYSIENKIEQKDQQIPRLMLKNLVENAVKHGIKGKENGGTIKIELFEKNHFIYITVDDTGRGRKQAISSDSGIGTSTYQKLFSTLNHKNKDNATFEITDKEQGTKVEVRIPKDYKYN